MKCAKIILYINYSDESVHKTLKVMENDKRVNNVKGNKSSPNKIKIFIIT